MARYIRNTVLLAKTEVTYGTDPTPTGAANAMLVSNVSVEVAYSNVDRDLLRGYFGGSDQLVGTRSVNISFDVELAGSGTAATAPAWGPLLKACGFSETATTFVTYAPISTAIGSVTIYYYLDGALHKLLGCRGSVSFKMDVGGKPTMNYKFTGLDGGLTAATNATPTLTAFKTPIVVTNTHTGDVTLGCTLSSGSLSGGTTYTSQGLSIDLNANIQFTPLLGGETIDFNQRQPSGSVSLDLTAADQVSFKTAVDANTTTSMGFQHGSAAGYIALFYAPVVQRLNPKLVDLNGRAMIGYDLRFLPSAGNDELQIITK